MLAPGSASEPAIKTGQIISGKYRVERVLGAGAMGMVLQATDLALRRRVAIKFMIAGGRAGRQHEERFVREAQIAGRLRSEHTARVLDLGTIDGGAPYIVMEYLKGKDLAATLQERGPLPIEEAVTYILQASDALAEAHAAGIVHRDIKPANLFLTRGSDGAPCIKVVDFGVAKHKRGAVDLTATAQVLGSPLYMPPESMNGSKDADQRVDIWALGVTLFELLAGERPFQATEMIVLITRVCFKDPEPLETLRPDVPKKLVDVVLRCLEKEPGNRWPTVAALASALAPFASARSASYPERIAGAQHAERMTEPMPPPEPESSSEPESSAVDAPPVERVEHLKHGDRSATLPFGGTTPMPAPGRNGAASSLDGTRFAPSMSTIRSAHESAPEPELHLVVEARGEHEPLARKLKVGLAFACALLVALLALVAFLVFSPGRTPVGTIAASVAQPPSPPVVSAQATAPLGPPVSAPATAPDSSTARTKSTAHITPTQPRAPAAKQADLPEGPRR